MNLYLRLLAVLARILVGPKQGVLDASKLYFRVWPHDCDLNLHMNNGRYLTLMDLGRIHLIGQIKILRELLRRGWMPVLGAVEINFIRPLNPLQKFCLTTRMLTWDEKYFYIEQRFERGGRLHALAHIKGLFVHGSAPVANSRVLALTGSEIAAPPPPAVIGEWNALLALKKQHTR